LPKTGAEVEELERCAGCAILQASEDFVVIRVSQDTLLDEPELAYTWPREDLPGLFALSFESAAKNSSLTTTHTSIDVWDDIFRRYTTPVFKQFSKGRCQLVLEALVIPGCLRRASQVLLRKMLPLLDLGRHDARALFEYRARHPEEFLVFIPQNVQKRAI